MKLNLTRPVIQNAFILKLFPSNFLKFCRRRHLPSTFDSLIVNKSTSNKMGICAFKITRQQPSKNSSQMFKQKKKMKDLEVRKGQLGNYKDELN